MIGVDLFATIEVFFVVVVAKNDILIMDACHNFFNCALYFAGDCFLWAQFSYQGKFQKVTLMSFGEWLLQIYQRLSITRILISL